MGVSTDGILAFGWDLGEEGSTEWAQPIWDEISRLRESNDGDFDVEDLYMLHSDLPAVPNPWDELKDKPEEWYQSGEYKAWKSSTDLDGYYDVKKAAVEACPFELVNDCSYDYPMYLLVVRGSHLHNSRGYPKKVHVDWFTQNWAPFHTAAQNIEKVLGLEPPEPPSFILASFWG